MDKLVAIETGVGEQWSSAEMNLSVSWIAMLPDILS